MKWEKVCKQVNVNGKKKRKPTHHRMLLHYIRVLFSHL